MERLTSRKYGEISCTGRIIPYSPYCSGCITSDCDCGIVEDIVKKLADYEDLEEQGRLVKLPCKVGDTVYIIFYNNTIGKSTVVSFKMIAKGWAIKTSDWSYLFTDIGKTVFLTKSEAEAKLKELRGRENDR